MARGPSLREILRLNLKKHQIHSAAACSPPPPPPPPASSSEPCRRISLHHPSLRPLQNCKSMRQLFQIQAHLVVTGLFQDPYVASRVLKFAADFAYVDYTVLIFQRIEPPDAFCVNTVMKTYSKSPDPRLAVVFYFEMLGKGFFPNSFTFPSLANSCAKIPSLSDGETCHGQAVKNGVDDVLHVQNSMINMYASCGSVECARILFDGMPQRDLISWNSMVDGYVMVEDLVSARQMFNQMPERNVVSWNTMIAGYSKAMDSGCSLDLFREMQKTGLKGSVTTLVSVIAASAQSRKLNEGRSVHGFFVRNFDEVNLILDTALVDMYCKCGRVEVARALFDRVPERNLVCWNVMILGHSIHGCPEDGLALFEEMVGRGYKEEATHDRSEFNHVLPDEVTFVGVLCACRRADLLSEGKRYFHQITEVYNIIPSFAHHWCLANLYAGLGFAQEAEEVLRGMPEKAESLVWGGLLWKCRYHGDIELGESIAKMLIELEP